MVCIMRAHAPTHNDQCVDQTTSLEKLVFTLHIFYLFVLYCGIAHVGYISHPTKAYISNVHVYPYLMQKMSALW